VDEYRIDGSTAYALQPVKRPCRLPEEPKKAVLPEKKTGVAPFAVLGTVVALALLFGVIFSHMRLFEAKNERMELEQKVQELILQQELLRAQYERGVDMEAVAQRAAELGMHLPRPEQIVEIFISEPEPAPTEPEEKLGLFEALRAMIADMKAYFSEAAIYR
jgi:cell division protein FtsL